LEELGVDFEVRNINLLKGEHKSPEVLAANPLGKLPAFKDGDVCIIESGAMVYYALEKWGAGKGLVPAAGTPENAVYHQVIAYSVTAEATVAKAFVEAYFKGGFGEGKGGNRTVFEEAAKEFTEVHLPIYEKWLGDNEWFGGSSFSAADAFSGWVLKWASLPYFEGRFITSPKILAYIERFAQRPSVQKAYAGSPM